MLHHDNCNTGLSRTTFLQAKIDDESRDADPAEVREDRAGNSDSSKTDCDRHACSDLTITLFMQKRRRYPAVCCPPYLVTERHSDAPDTLPLPTQTQKPLLPLETQVFEPLALTCLRSRLH